jgi:hypothetical protein
VINSPKIDGLDRICISIPGQKTMKIHHPMMDFHGFLFDAGIY